MADEKILYKKEGNVGVITFNRPEKMNAVTPQMNARIHEIVEEIKRDNEVRSVILTGTGRAFCAGTDVSNAEATGIPGKEGLPQSHAERQIRRFTDRPSTLDRMTSLWGMISLPKPVICAMNGAAVGLGAEYTLHCDIRIAAQSARWGMVFVHRGWVPDTGAGTFLLSRLVGLSKALELVCGGEIIDAPEMLRIGVVSQVVPDAELMPAAMAMAKKLAKGAPLAVRMAKELIYRSLERNIEEHLISNSSAFRMLTDTEDHAEGVKSFLEKREPRWKSR